MQNYALASEPQCSLYHETPSTTIELPHPDDDDDDDDILKTSHRRLTVLLYKAKTPQTPTATPHHTPTTLILRGPPQPWPWLGLRPSSCSLLYAVPQLHVVAFERYADNTVDTGHWIPPGHPLLGPLRVLPHPARCRNLHNRAFAQLDMREGTSKRGLHGQWEQ